MEITDYHAKYYAYELTRRYASDNLEKLATTLLDAQVDLNPHQIEAALFAFKSPLSKGAILADEVGLGKTIEAGLLISQKWAERKRKILIIVPSSLRNQWNQEIYEKFFIPSVLLESKSFNSILKANNSNPFVQDSIVICSYHFARSKADYINKVNWDLVVIDEAHRLRNVYKSSNKIARAIYHAIAEYPKILLTATPLQNSLLELYGLVSFIDEFTFGDLKSFKAQFAKLTSDDNFDDLKARLTPVCKRTLRRQVLEYIKFTNRIPITQEFIPSHEEQVLYDHISDYLRRDNLYALPSSQRQLITLILRKLLASSTFAIAGALNSLLLKLEVKLKDIKKEIKVDEDLAEDFEALEELSEEWQDDNENQPTEEITEEQIDAIKKEIEDLKRFRDLAESITHNAKGKVLLTALKAGFAKAKELGAQEKTIIFTESRRTQEYLLSILSSTEYKDRIVLFNGSNNDEKSRQIYQTWAVKYKGTERVTGSQTADMRSAIVDYFRNQAVIMIATEAAAEGINLQFCSLVINYDLPWNPQRIEQRIGRCHRYGQNFDVVVVNFLNKNNAADQRVYQLLSEKFKLFSGVFGASDEVLGSIESGVDFEKRIAQIYQECRTPEEIQASFDQLQNELDEQISEKMQTARQKLLESFDEEVHEKLRVNLKESKEYLNKHENMLWELTRFSLKDHAEFIDGQTAFKLGRNPFPQDSIPIGLYKLGRNVEDAHIYRMGHTLAQNILQISKQREIPNAELIFNYSNHPLKISVMEPLIGKKGSVSISCLSVESFQAEDYIIFGGMTDNETVLDEEKCRRLFSLPAEIINTGISIKQDALEQIIEKRKVSIIDGIASKNTDYFEEELDKLDKWADDKRKSLKINLKDLDDKIKELKKEARLAANLPDKLKLQKQVKTLESKRDAAWLDYNKASKEIEDKKDKLINNIEDRLNQKISLTPLFTIRWSVI